MPHLVPTDVTVTEDQDRQRYDASADGSAIAGSIDHLDTSELVVVEHTEVDPSFEGRGVGSARPAPRRAHVRGQRPMAAGVNSTRTDAGVPRFDGLRALFINATLEHSPEVSNTDGLTRVSSDLMRAHGVQVEMIRALDHDIATGLWPDMTEHGADADDWPAIFEEVLAADILVLSGPI